MKPFKYGTKIRHVHDGRIMYIRLQESLGKPFEPVFGAAMHGRRQYIGFTRTDLEHPLSSWRVVEEQKRYHASVKEPIQDSIGGQTTVGISDDDKDEPI